LGTPVKESDLMLKKPAAGRVLRRAVLPIALAFAAVVAVPSAQAWNLQEHHYERFLSPGQTWTESLLTYPANQVTGNIAVYEGAGSVGVCQRTWDDISGVWREGCGTNAVGNALNLTPYYGHLLYPGIKNNSPNAHTIDDYFYTGTP
jgi:hypothetical protein